jgi:hypothetical protein
MEKNGDLLNFLNKFQKIKDATYCCFFFFVQNVEFTIFKKK